MKSHYRVFCRLALAAGVAAALIGCGGAKKATTPSPQASSGRVQTDSGKQDERAGHVEGEHREAGHGSEAEMKAAVEKLASYPDAMHAIEELREHIEHLIKEDKFADVHPPAQHISLIAKRLPELAQKSNVPSEHLKDINTQSRDLANLFDEIDEAADAGKRPETEAAFAKMVKLIDSLEAHDKLEGEQKKKD